MYEVLGVLPGLTAGGGVPPEAFAKRYRTYFDKPLATFPKFLIETAQPAEVTPKQRDTQEAV